MSLPWTRQQREWLHALGHPVLALAGRSADPEPDELGAGLETGVETGLEPGTATPAARTGVVEPRALQSVPPRDPDPPMASGQRAPPASAQEPRVARDRPAGRGLADRLYRALLRATGRRTAGEGTAVLQALEVDIETLRGDAAAKRALWTRLRAERRRGRA
jgi:hypothetical protein